MFGFPDDADPHDTDSADDDSEDYSEDDSEDDPCARCYNFLSFYISYHPQPATPAPTVALACTPVPDVVPVPLMSANATIKDNSPRSTVVDIEHLHGGNCLTTLSSLIQVYLM